MDSWSSPQVPALPGRGESLALFDSARQAVTPTVQSGEPARMYVCGITPYDATHLGHAATMITFDLIYRMWTDAGYRVTYVQNVTQIERLLAAGAAYRLEDGTGDVYFDISASGRFGYESHYDRELMLALSA